MAKVTLPAGATKLQKNMAAGMGLPVAVAKTKSGGKSTPKR